MSSQQKVSHSLNRLRTKMKKRVKGQEKTDQVALKSSVSAVSTSSGGGGSTSNSPTAFLGAPREKRKAMSVSTPPDLSSSPIHQVSLGDLLLLAG